MSVHINLSQNELLALLTRSFEALYGHERDYYDMARTVLWLECCGHKGVGQMINAIPVLETNTLAVPNFSHSSPNHIIVDGGGHSLISIAKAISDLAMACAADNECSHLGVLNVPDSKPLIGVLSSMAFQGFAAVAICNSNFAMITPGMEYPTIYVNNGINTLSLICAQTEEGLNEHITGKGGNVLVNAQVQQEAYTASRDRGVNLKRSYYDTLNLIANRLLVKATWASRRGAGE